jgi:hypothetical protein
MLCFYSDHFDDAGSLTHGLNCSSAVLIQEGKKACDSKTVLRDLAVSKAHFRTIRTTSKQEARSIWHVFK